MVDAASADRLRLVQWLSPAFPIGAFAWSQGLETAIVDGDVTDAASLHSWIAAVLTHGTGRADAILLAQARATDDLSALQDLALALAPCAERAAETMEQGTAFARTIAALTGEETASLAYPLAVGRATRALQVTTEEVLTLWLQGLAATLVSVGVRFIPLGQTDGQRVLAGLTDRIVALAAELEKAPLSALSSSTPRADLAAMRHETLQTRIYRS